MRYLSLFFVAGLLVAASPPAQAAQSAGKYTSFEISRFDEPGPRSIVAGPDGNLWFTEFLSGKIGRLTPSGVVTEFPMVSSATSPIAIINGPDGTLWFTQSKPNALGRITTEGVITLYPHDGVRGGIALGPDGNLW